MDSLVVAQDESVQTLTRLGLTFCQARVYLALAKSGMSTAKTISKASNVAREDIYRIIPTLQELGLVEKTITSPSMFRAIPMQDCLSILMDRRVGETLELQKKTRELLQNFKKNNEDPFQEVKPQFRLIPPNMAALKIRGKLIENTQTSLDVIDSWKRFQRTGPTYREVFIRMMERGVKTRAIIDAPENKGLFAILDGVAKDFSKKYFHENRYLLKPPLAIVAIHDKKEVLITTIATTYLAESPCLWSNNPTLLAIVQDYFEMMWLTALEEIPEEHELQ